jgi:hypothetical protein
MTKIRNSKPVLVIEYWNLRFVCNLVLGVWDFIYSTTLAKRDLRRVRRLTFLLMRIIVACNLPFKIPRGAVVPNGIFF